MDLTDIISMIGNVAFPILACVGLFKFVYKMYSDVLEMKSTSETKLVEILNNQQDQNLKFTKVLTSLQKSIEELSHSLGGRTDDKNDDL